jgi:hypothetical protein
MRVALRPALLVLACVVLGLAGCGGGPKRLTGVHGRLLDHGKPLTVSGTLPPGDPGIRLTFLPAGEGEGMQSADAVVDPQTGTFQLDGDDQKGVAPGKYRIVLSLGAYSAGGDTDQLKGAFGPENSPISKDVTEDNQDITIDVGKDAGPRS